MSRLQDALGTPDIFLAHMVAHVPWLFRLFLAEEDLRRFPDPYEAPQAFPAVIFHVWQLLLHLLQ